MAVYSVGLMAVRSVEHSVEQWAASTAVQTAGLSVVPKVERTAGLRDETKVAHLVLPMAVQMAVQRAACSVGLSVALRADPLAGLWALWTVVPMAAPKAAPLAV